MKTVSSKIRRDELKIFERPRRAIPDVKLDRHISMHRPMRTDPKCPACKELSEAAGFKLTP